MTTMHANRPYSVDLPALIAAAQFLPVGISIMDRALKARFWNRASIEILDFPEHLNAGHASTPS